ncbi:Inhibitor I29 domain containing protein [Asbolus verrucosus]|uniref:Inhibitor I29 domain containing protein n=1 Tax=Asbolus verrucosus TaxID=1661398 RepID=A0A482VMJ9_ASBVE|nr:Inhibitor I29 domain containing protein [Asbolus verrucosus]
MASEQPTLSLTDEEISQKWTDYKKKFKKNYPDPEEDAMRKQIFVEKLQHVDEHNKKYEQKLITYKIGINQFSDLTKEERISE